MHGKYGKISWADLIEPTRAIAEAGFQVSPRLAGLIAQSAGKRKLDFFEPAKSYFFDDAGMPLEAGYLLRNPAFTKTLALIQKEGSKPFYEGALGEQIVSAVKTEINPGILTMEDLKAYEVIERAPVCVAYRGKDVCGMGPPTSGGLTVGQILGILSSFELPATWDAKVQHLYLEAAKLAYADRGLYMADSDFTPVPTDGLINADYLAERAKLIDPMKATEKAAPGTPPMKVAVRFAPDTQLERPGTSHFSIVDKDGNVVSMTTTIETGFGSRVMVGGFLLNNELTDFSRAPGKDGIPIANRVEGGKRPRSSMAPTIVLENGAPVLAIGSPGGSRIINYVASAIISILDFGMDPQDALNRPHVVNRNGNTDMELQLTGSKLVGELEAMGHVTKLRDLNSGLHAILLNDGKLIGGADPRREGKVMGE